jgi:hypothetical protein
VHKRLIGLVYLRHLLSCNKKGADVQLLCICSQYREVLGACQAFAY